MSSDFEMIVPESTGGERKETPLSAQGPHVAVCVQMIDLGTVDYNYKGDDKTKREIQFVFELPFERFEFKEGDPAQPKWLYTKFNYVLSKGSNFKKFLEGVYGKTIPESMYKTFNVAPLLGKPYIIQLVHALDKKDPDKTWENIGSAQLITEKNRAMYNVDWATVKAEHTPIAFSLANGGKMIGEPVFGELGKWTRERILMSHEAKAFIANGGIPYVKQATGDPVSTPEVAPTSNPLTSSVQATVESVPESNNPLQNVKTSEGGLDSMPDPDDLPF